MSSFWSHILQWVLAAIIVVDNGLVIYLITTRRSLRNPTNWFVVSLAVADFGIGAMCLAIRDDSSASSMILNGIWLVFVHASMTNLCTLTLDRYLAIVRPLRYVPLMTKRRVALIIFAAWSVAFPTYISDTATFGTTVFILHAIITTSVCVFLMVTTAWIFLVSQKHSRQNAAVVKQLMFNYTVRCKVPQPHEAASAKMIYVVVAVFLSYSVVHFFFMLCKYSTFCSLSSLDETVIVLNNLLTLINSLANPIAYALFKREIRKEFKRFLFTLYKMFCITASSLDKAAKTKGQMPARRQIRKKSSSRRIGIVDL